MNRIDHIEQRPDVMLGKPCIKGTRLTVERVLEMPGQGATVETVLETYPFITKDDVQSARALAPGLSC